MPYPRRLLNENETVALDLHPHWWHFVKPATVLVLSIMLGLVSVTVRDAPGKALVWLAIGAIVLSAIWMVKAYFEWTTTNFVVTSDRVIFRSGVLSKHGIEMPLERVNNVLFRQSLFERLIGAGDLIIESGAEMGQQRFTDVSHPDRVQNIIHTEMEQNIARTYGGAKVGGYDIITQLEKLEGLRDRGTLTEAEFVAQKDKLLRLE